MPPGPPGTGPANACWAVMCANCLLLLIERLHLLQGVLHRWRRQGQRHLDAAAQAKSYRLKEAAARIALSTALDA